jgi:2-polyprenyl-6-methoxyphenol hydroxylase-like FAD-dependent oxidoreductase
MVLGDITFSSPPNPPIATNDITGTTSPHGLVLVLPLPSSISSGYQQQDQSSETVTYRIFCSVPASEGTPPTAPPTTYLQALLDEFGPISLSSDASVNPHPVHISDTKWSARFRTHSAIAEGFFVRFGDKQKTTNAHEQNGGIIFLVGDAAHIHSPAGGQGMNLGLRDAIGLGPVLAAHLQECQQSPSVDVDNIIQEYASTRHARAISIIRLTKRMMSSARSAGNKFTVAYWLIRLVGKISWARNMMVWRLSGLGSR